jgi:ABC transporter substrate binding protein (PQQ-dependent alcohol dehydrogenase system)
MLKIVREARFESGRLPTRSPSAALALSLVWATVTFAFGDMAQAQHAEQIPIGYLSQVIERPPNLSNLDQPPADEGVAGGQLAIADNNTTGRFLQQNFALRAISVPAEDNAEAAFQTLLKEGLRFVILNVPADVLLRIADGVRDSEVLLLNAGAPDDRLRGPDCRNNILHIAPSRAMLTDALAQYLIWKRWPDWLLIVGRRDGDRLFASALRESAKKFGGRIVAEKTWDFGADARRPAQAEVPVFTQGFEYDIVMVADEIGEFGEYLAYRTWLPRPVAGTQGLTPTSWHRSHEQWGAAQLQSRFLKAAGRHMTPLDYQVWASVRAIGEAATRTKPADFAKIKGYMLSEDFDLAGFKGQKLTFRRWNQQLRQPILLAGPTALVSVSPQEGFLHPRSPLDTLGLDEAESRCRLH